MKRLSENKKLTKLQEADILRQFSKHIRNIAQYSDASSEICKQYIDVFYELLRVHFNIIEKYSEILGFLDLRNEKIMHYLKQWSSYSKNHPSFKKEDGYGFYEVGHMLCKASI